MTDFYTLSDAEQIARLENLAKVALTRWDGTFDQVKLIKYRENAVFSAQRSDGTKVAVRVHRHGYHSDAALLSELHWMQTLADAGIPVPPIVRAACGSPFIKAEAPGIPEPRQVDLLGWMAGSPVGSSEDGLSLDPESAERLFFDAGVLAAKVHDHTQAMALPENFTRHAWDENGLIGDEPLWGRFWELEALTPDQRDLLLRASACARRDLAAFGRNAANYGLIHADFVPENLLSENGQLKLIDFDDCGFGWNMFELATALYFNIDEPYYPAIERALFAGYRSVRALPAETEALLPLFLFLRGTTYLGWIQTRPETQTARELGPMLIARLCQLAATYLAEAALPVSEGPAG
ncbi:phosphotransferase enzyme family protein [Govanella unica]|uniref:Phosphotransferase n=1 Tax=Govanella unica TaxID=2975056 RepID=A0A9X3Z6A4_9PROT|nr:phosphotransferase [Govania unica]MDA5192931.1 phosphotransferase [Govania unica]